MKSSMRLNVLSHDHYNMVGTALLDHDYMKKNVESILLGDGNIVSVYLDQSPDSISVKRYHECELVFNIVCLDSNDVKCIKEGFEVTLNEDLGPKYNVEFDIEYIEGDKYRVVMTELEELVCY